MSKIFTSQRQNVHAQKMRGQSAYFWLVILGPLLPLALAIGSMFWSTSHLDAQHDLLEQRLEHSKLLSELNSSLENQVQAWNTYLLYSESVEEALLWQNFKLQERKTFELGQQLLVRVNHPTTNERVREIIYSLEVLRVAYQEARNIYWQSQHDYLNADNHVKNIEDTPTFLINDLMNVISRDAIGQSLQLQQNAWRTMGWICLALLMVTGGFVLLSGGLVRRWFQRQVQDQAHINWLLEHDYLTRLNNRNSFIEQAEKNLSQGRPFYIVHISVSNLKHTAKIHGHSIAESLLQAIAERLLKLLPEQALAARSIGTDFLLLLPEQQVDEVDDFGYRLMQELSAAYNVQGFRHELRPYIGISYSVTDGESVNELLQAADIATVQTRQQETAIQHYHPALSKEIKDKHAQVQALQDAIGRSAVEIIYQPKVCLQSRRIVGFEALSRLQGVDKNLQSPVVFIPLAEETGLIKPLGYLVLLKAIKQLAQWRDKGHLELTMAINLSPLQLDDEKLPYYIKQLCQRYGIPPQRVELELTESNFVQGQHPTLNCLRQFGFKLSVDDFGVGYSNLGYMVSLQPQQIKIDRSFVCNLEEDMNKQAVVNALTTLAEGMDIQLVAEGIESETQLELLCRMGIHVGQGYLFSRPVAWHEAELLMQPAIARAG